MTQISNTPSPHESIRQQVVIDSEINMPAYKHGILAQAALDIRDDMETHVHDIAEHNRLMLALRTTAVGRIGQRAINGGRAALYTTYFWADDYPMRLVTKLSESTTTNVLTVGTASTAIGGTLALVRRRQLLRMYENQGADISDEGPRLAHATTASILGAPHTVKEMAIRSIAYDTDDEALELTDPDRDSESTDEVNGETIPPRRRVRLMSIGAVGLSAAVYGYLQGFTAGPVIDVIDSALPGEGFVKGDIPATTAFVVPAIYLTSATSVWYNRRQERKSKKQKTEEIT